MTPTLSLGDVIRLPTGNTVVLLRPLQNDEVVFDCGYIRDGTLAPKGTGNGGRVALRSDFIERFGERV